MHGDLIWGGEHTIQRIDDVLWNCAPETYIILFTIVTLIHLTKRGNKRTACSPKGTIIEGLFEIKTEKAKF